MANPLDSEPPGNSARRKAWVQVVFGQVQMLGAIVGVYLWLATGFSRATTAVVTLTMVITVMSRLLFHGDAGKLRYWASSKYQCMREKGRCGKVTRPGDVK